MRFNQYLRLAGQLYFEGAKSDFHPNILRRIGGSMALAAEDVNRVRIDQDSILGLERRIADRWTAARMGWRRHSEAIRQRLTRGETPSQAVYAYMRAHNTHPHTPQRIRAALQRTSYEGISECSAWALPTIQFRRRFARGSAVMTDTFGAITTLAALAVTADDWQNATPEEWDTALNAGEIGQTIGQMAGAHADARGGNTAGFDRHEGTN